MNAVPFRTLLLLLAVLAAGFAPPRGAEALLGASPADVKERLGLPARVSRQVYQLRCQEQWHYGAPHHLRVNFDCPRGRKPRVTRLWSLAER